MTEPEPRASGGNRSSGPGRRTAKSRSAGATTRRLRSESVETRRMAALILEVLAGVRTSTEAAEVLGVSANRYYLLEARALEGLVHACRRRPRGPNPSPEREVARLKREVTRLERDRDRGQALLRLAERAVGVPARNAKSAGKKGSGKRSGGAKKKRQRRPTARALRVVKLLQGAEENSVDEPKVAPDHGSQVES